MPLTDRASILREFYRLTGTSGSDRAATAHDSGTLEGIYNLLQHGAWDAQLYLIQVGEAALWLTTTSGAFAWSGADSTHGGRYTNLPSDFLRAAGSERESPLREPGGRRWGQLIDFEDRFSVWGNRFWFQEGQLWVARGASPPSDLVLDYHERLATLADSAAGPPVVDNTVDFPIVHRPLIPAFAAERAAYQSWFPLDEAGKASVIANLRGLKRKARAQARRATQPRKMRRPAGVGRWWR